MTLDVKKILKIVSLSAFLIFIVVFVFFRTKDVVLGVKIKDVNIVPEALPMDSIGKASGIRKVTGNAKNAVNLTLNDRAISVDQEGNFNETIVLLSGYNIISIYARDEFGNSDEKNYKLMY